jgi:tetratricopeptide (TPR) repeat protein
MRLAAALVLALAATAFAGDAAEVQRAVEEALARDDRAEELRVLDSVIAPDAPRDRKTSVQAARLAMERVGGSEGNLRAARILCDTLKTERGDGEGAFTLAKVLGRRVYDFDLPVARELFEGLVGVYPEILDFRYDLAQTYRHSGLADLARAQYEKISEIAPAERRAKYELAFLHEDRGDVEAAAKVYDELIALSANDPQPDLLAHLDKGWLLLNKAHDCDRARKALEAGLAAANASAPGPARDEFLNRFDWLRADLVREETHRKELRELRRHLDGVLVGTAAAWAIVLGGGLVLLRRAKSV